MVCDRGYIKKISGKNITYDSMRGIETTTITLPAIEGSVITSAIELRQKPHTHGLLFIIRDGYIYKIRPAKPSEVDKIKESAKKHDEKL